MDTLGEYDSSSDDDGGGRGMSRYVKVLKATVASANASKAASSIESATFNTSSSYSQKLSAEAIADERSISVSDRLDTMESSGNPNTYTNTNNSMTGTLMNNNIIRDGSSGSDSSDGEGIGPSLPSIAKKPPPEGSQGEARPKLKKNQGSAGGGNRNSNSSSNSNSNEVEDLIALPVSHQLDLHGHTKAVVCLSVDSSGNRVVSGSLDYNVNIYDFGGMDSRGEAFRTFESFEGHPVTAIAHSPNGDRFIIGTKSCQPRVYSRDAQLIITFVRGDNYIKDLCNTKGHTNEVTCVMWHPTKVDTIVTSSLDGSVRIWDLKGEASFSNLCNKHVLKIRAGSADGKKVGAQCFVLSNSGELIVVGATDGSLHFWVEKKAYSRTDHVINLAHGNGKSGVQSVLLNADATMLYTRGEDACIKIWSIKKLSASACVRTISDVPSIYTQSNLYLSPDESTLVCGVSVFKDSADSNSNINSSSSSSSSSNSSSSSSSTSTSSSSNSSNEGKKTRPVRAISSTLSFFDAKRNLTGIISSDRVAQISLLENASIIIVKWVHSTNQIVCSLSNGTIRVFYDPILSKKGAVISTAKKVSRKEMGVTAADFGIGTQQILTPHALPLFRKEQGSHKRKKEIEVRDSLIPSKPNMQGPQHNVNTSFFFTQYVMEGKKKADDLMRDPRQALLEVDEKARSDPLFFGKAYQDTQPTTILEDKTFEEEALNFKKKQRSFEDRDK